MENAIVSGETTIIETNEFEWQKNISSGEYLDIESIEIGANNTIALRKKIPFYKYIINYLLLTHYNDLGFSQEEIGDKAADIFTSIENGEKNQDFEKIIDLVVDLFKEKNLMDIKLEEQQKQIEAQMKKENTSWMARIKNIF